MTDPARQHYPEILDELAAVMAASLVDAGIAASTARAVADKCAEHVRTNFSGQVIYIPKGLGYNLARRNAEIRRRLAAGEPRAAICREFGLTTERLRQIGNDTTPCRR